MQDDDLGDIIDETPVVEEDADAVQAVEDAEEGDDAEAVEAVEEEAPVEVKEPEKAVERHAEPTMVPIGVVQALRQEMRELRSTLNPPAPAPDFYEDPQAAVQYQMAPLQQALTSTKLEMSRFMAEREFGPEKVEAAFNYYNENPAKSQDLLNHPSPFHAAVAEFDRQQIASEIGNDPAAYKERVKAEVLAEIQAGMVTKQAREKVAAPSLASVTGMGGSPKTNWAGPVKLDDLIG